MTKANKRLRLAELRRDGWEILNVRKLEADCERQGYASPFPFLPKRKRLEDLRAGQRVKLVFEMRTGGSRMAWVEVKGKRNGFYFGRVVEPAPECLRNVGRVVFQRDYVLEVE